MKKYKFSVIIAVYNEFGKNPGIIWFYTRPECLGKPDAHYRYIIFGGVSGAEGFALSYI